MQPNGIEPNNAVDKMIQKWGKDNDRELSPDFHDRLMVAARRQLEAREFLPKRPTSTVTNKRVNPRHLPSRHIATATNKRVNWWKIAALAEAAAAAVLMFIGARALYNMEASMHTAQNVISHASTQVLKVEESQKIEEDTSKNIEGKDNKVYDAVAGGIVFYAADKILPTPKEEFIGESVGGFWVKSEDRFLKDFITGVGVFLTLSTQDTARDFRQAAEWHQHEAAKGDLRAMVKLSLMYAVGLGVDKNKASASKWYKKAKMQDQKETKRYLATYLPAALPGAEIALKNSSPDVYMKALLSRPNSKK